MDGDTVLNSDTVVDEIMHEIEGYHAFEQRQGRAIRDGALTADQAHTDRAEELAAIRQRVRQLIAQSTGTPSTS